MIPPFKVLATPCNDVDMKSKHIAFKGGMPLPLSAKYCCYSYQGTLVLTFPYRLTHMAERRLCSFSPGHFVFCGEPHFAFYVVCLSGYYFQHKIMDSRNWYEGLIWCVGCRPVDMYRCSRENCCLDLQGKTMLEYELVDFFKVLAFIPRYTVSYTTSLQFW